MTNRDIYNQLEQGNSVTLSFISRASFNTFRAKVYKYKARNNKILNSIGFSGDSLDTRRLSITILDGNFELGKDTIVKFQLTDMPREIQGVKYKVIGVSTDATL